MSTSPIASSPVNVTDLPVRLDGDAYEGSPQEVEIVPRALWVAVPKGIRSPLFLE